MASNNNQKIHDLPKGGALSVYRQLATFNWQDMLLFIQDSEVYRFKVDMRIQ